MKIFAILFLFITFTALAEETAAPQPDTPVEPVQATLTPELDDRWRFGLGGSFSLTSKLKFEDGTVTGVSGKVTADIDYEKVFSIELDVRKMNRQSWGFIGGLTYDAERKLTGGTITAGGNTATLSSSNPSKIQATVIYGSAAYRWEQFYLPFGFNVASINYSAPSGYTGSISAKGGLGAQLGVGYFINENFVVEGHSRVVGVKLSGVSGTTTSDYGNGFLSNVLLTGKYIF